MYIKVANQNQIELLAGLAKEIWTNHFGRMVEGDILENIIKQVQSQEAIAHQIEEGFLYYIIQSEETPVGYFAYRISNSEKELFLSKLYILASERRKGRGQQVINHLEEICKAHNITKLRLTVHHKNTSAIKVYEKGGFRNIGSITRDFGNGIVVDDYEMEKLVV